MLIKGLARAFPRKGKNEAALEALEGEDITVN